MSGQTAPAVAIVVSGSRHAKPTPPVRLYIAQHLHAAAQPVTDPGSVLLIYGAAPGVDEIAYRWATHWGWRTASYPADWTRPCLPTCDHRGRRQRRDGTRYCPAAGHDRNQQMIDRLAAYPATIRRVVVAFPGPNSTGTTDCIRRARAAGFVPTVHPLALAGSR